MTTISIDDVQKLARLSAVTVTDEEATHMANELSEILGYVELLNGIDTEGVEPTYQVTGLKNVTRKDEAIDGVSHAALFKNISDQHEGMIKVPRVIE